MRTSWYERRLGVYLGCGLIMLFSACSEEPRIRAVGELCQSDGECGSSLCYDEVCLEPSRDDDGDGLINELEAQLGTNSQLADSDGDGVIDPIEIGLDFSAPLDEDGDSKIDAPESNLQVMTAMMTASLTRKTLMTRCRRPMWRSRELDLPLRRALRCAATQHLEYNRCL